jgi:hypothetical protein
MMMLYRSCSGFFDSCCPPRFVGGSALRTFLIELPATVRCLTTTRSCLLALAGA